jgi:thiol:disulfide interchange protein DsbC
MINLQTGENLTNAKRAVIRLEKVSDFPVDDKVIFAAEGVERSYIDVFTDTTCPYCRKLHAEVPQLQAAGITVRYLPFPRGGRGSQGDRELRAVWCDSDPVQSMHLAKTQSTIPANDGSCEAASAVDAGYQLGVVIGIRGTPAIVLPDGTMISGYRPHADLISALGVETN